MIQSAKHLYSTLLATLRKPAYLSVLMGILCLGLTAVATIACVNWGGQPNLHKPATSKQKTSTGSKPAAQTSAQQTTSDAQQPTDSQASSAGSGSAQVASSSRSLVISPSVFTVPVNGSLTSVSLPISIQPSGGKNVNMPMLTHSSGALGLVFNFPAGPAKSSWSGEMLVLNTAPTGTYSMEIFAQDNSEAYYKATITIIVVEPTMEITVGPSSYDATNDALIYTIKLNRQYGFSEAIYEVGVTTADPGLNCYYAIADADTIILGCGHEDMGLPRPTNGTLSISVSTDTLVRTATASYSLPLL